MIDLQGKVAIVTGAARGTGAATARLLAAAGARVVVADVEAGGGRSVADAIGERACFLPLDVREEAQWAALVEQSLARWGRIDVLVNNAARLLIRALQETSAEEFRSVCDVNLLGPFLGIRAVAPAMRAQGRGSIVNVASVDALAGKNGVAAYASSKWGLRGLTRVAALELGRFGIRVNAVCPEAGSAEMIRPFVPEGVPLERVLAKQQPLLAYQEQRTLGERIDDVARMIVFLASDASASCTGADFCVDGGNLAGKIVRGAPGA